MERRPSRTVIIHISVRLYITSRKLFFPSGKEPASVIRRQCDRIHELLGSHAFDKRVTYTNPTGWFLDERGVIRDGLYGGDYIHLTENGYACVASHLIELMK